MKGSVNERSSCALTITVRDFGRFVPYPAPASSVDLQLKKRIFFFFFLSLSLFFSLKDVENLTRIAWSDISCEKALCLEYCESNLP